MDLNSSRSIIQRTKTSKTRVNVVTVLIYLICCIWGAVSLLPFAWMVSTSLRETYILFAYPPEFLPRNPVVGNYIFILTYSDFLYWLKNSAIVTTSVVIFSIFCSSLAGYAFAKKEFYGRNILFVLVLATLMVPGHVLLVPVFIILSKLNLVDTYPGLIIPGIASAFGIFLMTQYIRTIPNDLIDAAVIDGSSDFMIFLKIILPLCKPAIAALAILVFLGSWNNFVWPLIMTTTSKMRTLPVGLALFQRLYGTQWGVVMAGATIVFIPSLMIFLAFQKYFVQGIALTGLKG